MTSSRPLDDLSVLVTCYNKFEYVEDCFGALLELENLGAEIIVVDDGSTDGSSELLVSLQTEANSKIQIIKTANQGAGPARRLSIERAQTNFVFFLDIDDLPITPALQELMLAFRSSEADIAIGNYKIMQSAESCLMPVSFSAFQVVSISDFRNEFKEAMGWWRYIYKRDFLLQSHNMIGKAFEDFGNKKFVLDDLFWMIHLSSQNLEVLVSPASLSIYHYNLPEENANVRWTSYLKQVSYIPEAARKFLNFIKINGCDHNTSWIIKTTLDDIWNHIPLLSFFAFRDSYLASFKLTVEVLGKTPSGYFKASQCLCLAALKRAVRVLRDL
ncbi:WcaA Glycosyltransferases involved in cell wall biogenesis [Candidatus Nanopelagicaceae bacterium]